MELPKKLSVHSKKEITLDEAFKRAGRYIQEHYCVDLKSADVVLEVANPNRFLKHRAEHDCCILTPDTKRFRKESELQKRQRNNINMLQFKTELEHLRKTYGIGYSRVGGAYGYSENGKPQIEFERSFFVVNLTDSPKFAAAMYKLAKRFNQVSITYYRKGELVAFPEAKGTKKLDITPAGSEESRFDMDKENEVKQGIEKPTRKNPRQVWGSTTFRGNKTMTHFTD